MPTLVMPFVFGPLSGSIPLSDLDANFTQLTGWINPRNPTVGPIGSRPAAGTAGAIYMASDQNFRIYIDDGAAWQVQPLAVANQLPEADYFEYDGIGTPASPAAGKGRMYTGSGPSGLRIPSWLDAAGQVNDLSRVLVRVGGNPIKDIVNTTTETTLFSAAPTIKGGTLGTNRMLRIVIYADILNNTGGGQGVTIRFKYGGVTFASLQPTGLGSNAARRTMMMEARLFASSATNLQVGAAVVYVNFDGDGVAGGGSNNACVVRTSGHSAIGADSTADQTLDVTAQNTVANASLSTRPFDLLVEAA